MRLRLITVLAVTVASMVLPPSAISHETKHTDGDERGPLDVRRIAFDHDATKLKVTVRTDGRWGSGLLKARRYVLVYIDPAGGDGQGFYVTAKYRRGKLRGVVDKIRPDFGRDRVGRAKVGRPNRRTVRFRVRRSTIGAASGEARWNVQTYSGRHGDAAPAFDGSYGHGL